MSNELLQKTIRARFDHEQARKLLKEKYLGKMTFALAGGMWRAGPELQTVLLACPDESAVILDIYDTPVRVNTRELFAQSQLRWQEQMTAWLIEYEELNKQR